MKTIIFSNIIGDVFSNGKVGFIPNMEKILTKLNLNNFNLVYIDAPMDGYDCNIVFNNIIKCFKKININFKNISRVSFQNQSVDIPNENIIWFLTGGNPTTQMDIIKKFNLKNKIKNAEFVIGFCAGGINISKHAIITSDTDFKSPVSYNGLARMKISIEPHFNYEDSAFFNNRVKEIVQFTKDLKTSITAIPDTSLIYEDNNKLLYIGEITTFSKL